MHSQVSQAGLNPQCGIPTFALGVSRKRECIWVCIDIIAGAGAGSSADKVETRSAWGSTSHVGQRPYAFGVVAFNVSTHAAVCYQLIVGLRRPVPVVTVITK